MKIWWLFYTLWQGGQKSEGEKSFLFYSVDKSQMLLKKRVLVFSFMYLVSVDPMDRSINNKTMNVNSPVHQFANCAA